MKPLVLALDTTREFGSIALAEGDQILEEVLLHAPTGFGHVLYQPLASLLDRNGVKLQQVACFAAASGPGSFTGVRVGLACVKGLAEGVGKPAAAISNLRALASFGKTPLRAAVIDARRSQIYGALYNAAGELVSPEVVALFSDWVANLPGGQIELVAQEGLDLPGITVRAPLALAGAIARITFQMLERGEAQDPAALDANYVRRSDAEMFWKDY